jgi:serine/threonine-protein kinase RsbW
MMPDMELALSARAENIAVVRYALGGLGEAFAVPESKLADIRLAVTEACANVVVHAYPDGHHGPMEVIASKEEEALTVLVRDWGCGIGPRSDSPGLGLGLSLIAVLADSVQLAHDDIEHTEVRMTFLLGDSQTSTNARPGTNAPPRTSTTPKARTMPDARTMPGTSTVHGPGGHAT